MAATATNDQTPGTVAAGVEGGMGMKKQGRELKYLDPSEFVPVDFDVPLSAMRQEEEELTLDGKPLARCGGVEKADFGPMRHDTEWIFRMIERHISPFYQVG